MNSPETGIQEVPEKRILVGLIAGRIVNFVMANLAIRPLLIVNPQDATGKVNGVVFLDGQNDQGNTPGHPFVVPVGEYVRDVAYCPVPCDFDPGAELIAGTWHWPQRQPVMAESLSPETAVGFVAEIKALFDERDAGLLATVNEMLDSHNEMVRGVIGTLQAKQEVTIANGTTLWNGPSWAADLDAVAKDPSLAPGVAVEGAEPIANAGTGNFQSPAVVDTGASPESQQEVNSSPTPETAS